MSNVTLDWNGDQVYDRIVTAAAEAARETVDEAVDEAKRLTPVLTGAAQASVSRENDGLDLIWGFHVTDEHGDDRGIWIEIGANGRPGVYPLRRAADQCYPRIVPRIAGRLG